MSRFSLRELLFVIPLALIMSGAGVRIWFIKADGGSSTPAGQVLSNQANAVYSDSSGIGYATSSQNIIVTVGAVSGLSLTPDETQSSAVVPAHQQLTRIFRLCNTGNVSNTYFVSAADITAPARFISLHFDADADGTLSPADQPVTIGTTVSQALEPNACLNIIAVIETDNAAPQSTIRIRLTARASNSAANGNVEDTGTIINTVGQMANLTDPDNSSQPPQSLVEGKSRTVVSAGQSLNYSIAFRNSGGISADDVTLIDDLDSRLEYIADSLVVNQHLSAEANIADQGNAGKEIGGFSSAVTPNGNVSNDTQTSSRRITIHFNSILPGQTVQITFRARLSDRIAPGAGIINTAVITGANTVTPIIRSSDSIAIVNPSGMIYSGSSGGSVPVGNALITLSTDETGENRVATGSNTGFLPNESNANPFTTSAQGNYGFVLAPEQYGTRENPARYFVTVNADSYQTRVLEVLLHPTEAGLFAATVRALDGQPIVRADSLELTQDSVSTENLANLAFNIPMFESSKLEITKSADKRTAEIGDTVSYRVAVRNATAVPVDAVLIRDELPQSFHYAAGTAGMTTRAGIQILEPDISENNLIFHLGKLEPKESATVVYRVRVGANARQGEQLNSASTEGIFPTGEKVQTLPARAAVTVGGGIFSMQQVILGRVFEDANGNGVFDKNKDKPLSNIRIYLDNGQSVVTDSEGLYNFPSVRDGSVVISLDPLTLPDNFSFADKRNRNNQTKLLRTPLGGGGMLRQNFALQAATESNSDLQARASNYAPNLHDKSEDKHSSSQRQSPTKSAPEAQKADKSTNPLAPGTYQIDSTETLNPVAPGSIIIVSPQPNEVIKGAALELKVRVALHWSAAVEVNAAQISEKNIGERRNDAKNSITTLSYVGINTRPGPNFVRVTAIGPQGETGETHTMSAMGRGPAARLEIVSDKNVVQSGEGQSAALLRVRAFDKWNSPAADGQVAIETTAGSLGSGAAQKLAAAPPATKNLEVNIALASAAKTGAGLSPGQNTPNQLAGIKQQIVNLKDGEATIELFADSADEAKVRAVIGDLEAVTRVRFVPSVRPSILVGLAELSLGRSAPEMALRGRGDSTFIGYFEFFYRGSLFKKNLLTLSYDSQRTLSRTAEGNRLFGLDPLARVYPLYGDSSERFEDAQSNSKLYARLDRGRSFAMFGDFEVDRVDSRFVGYSRKLTGVKLHLENSNGDFLALTGARPDTTFARDIFSGSQAGLVRLSNQGLLAGSETVTLEVRDRRNPETIISSEPLIRSVDYNLDPNTGVIFFLRPISTFDHALNLIQVVITYEYQSTGLTSAVYTGEFLKHFDSLGLQIGFSSVIQRQDELGTFALGGVRAEQKLPHKGRLSVELAKSQGRAASAGNAFATEQTSDHNGTALRVNLEQPLDFKEAVLRADFTRTDEHFLNPFGATVAPGAQNAAVTLDLKPRSASNVQVGFKDERNKTENVDNNRSTVSLKWVETFSESLKTTVGFDHRSLSDARSGRDTVSNLFTIGAEYHPFNKLELTAKREQNLGSSDPTYPTQTTFGANYAVNSWTRLFYTQRLAEAPIVPISDTSGSGFTQINSRNELAFGVETRFHQNTLLNGRYQIENGANGNDAYAIVGLNHQLPINKKLSVDLGFERGFHLAGQGGKSFNNVLLGLGWQPTESFRSSARYEMRDRNGSGNVLTLAAAGKIGDNITALSRLQWGRTSFNSQSNASLNGTLAFALRPIKSDRIALLFSYNHRSIAQQSSSAAQTLNQERADVLSTDGLFQATKKLELYNRVAVKFGRNAQSDLALVSTLTYLTQNRAQYQFNKRFDVASELRMLMQPSSGTKRISFGTEAGFWVLPDLRLGVGYNFTKAFEPNGIHLLDSNRKGFYLTISSKISNIFNLFGSKDKNQTGAIAQEK